MNSEDEEREFLDQSWQYNRKAQDYQAEGYKLDDYDYNFNFDYETGSRYLNENELVKKKMEMFVRNQKFQVNLVGSFICFVDFIYIFCFTLVLLFVLFFVFSFIFLVNFFHLLKDITRFFSLNSIMLILTKISLYVISIIK